MWNLRRMYCWPLRSSKLLYKVRYYVLVLGVLFTAHWIPVLVYQFYHFRWSRCLGLSICFLGCLQYPYDCKEFAEYEVYSVIEWILPPPWFHELALYIYSTLYVCSSFFNSNCLSIQSTSYNKFRYRCMGHVTPVDIKVSSFRSHPWMSCVKFNV